MYIDIGQFSVLMQYFWSSEGGIVIKVDSVKSFSAYTNLEGTSLLILSSSIGSKSILKSPVWKIVPAGESIERAKAPGIEWLTLTNSIVNLNNYLFINKYLCS